MARKGSLGAQQPGRGQRADLDVAAGAAEEPIAATIAGDPAIGLERDVRGDSGGKLCGANEARAPLAAGKISAHGHARGCRPPTPSQTATFESSLQ
jgi:hypothetical protein